jgi:hypothetical protein
MQNAVSCVRCTMCMKWTHIGLVMSVCPSAWFNSRTAGRIWMKFCVDVMPLRTSLKSCFTVPTIRNTNMAGDQTCGVGSTLAPFAIQWFMGMDFRNVRNFSIVILCIVQNYNVVAAWRKNNLDLSTVRSRDLMRTRPVRCHRGSARYDLPVLIYVT